MGFLIEWVTNIIMFILLATVIDMLMPNSAMQKYTKIVTGLLLIAVILGPVLKLISTDFEEAMASITVLEASGTGNNSKNLIEMKKKEIQASQRAYILEQMAVQLKADAEEELMAQFGYEIAGISIDAEKTDGQGSPADIRKVAVRLSVSKKDGQTIKPVEIVDILASAAVPERDDEERAEAIGAFLAKKWDVPANTIEIAIEGGLNRGG